MKYKKFISTKSKTDYATIGENAKILLKKTETNQTVLAKMLGISTRQLSNYFNGIFMASGTPSFLAEALSKLLRYEISVLDLMEKGFAINYEIKPKFDPDDVESVHLPRQIQLKLRTEYLIKEAGFSNDYSWLEQCPSITDFIHLESLLDTGPLTHLLTRPVVYEIALAIGYPPELFFRNLEPKTSIDFDEEDPDEDLL